MKRHPFYSPSVLLIFRIFSIFASLILIYSNIMKLINFEKNALVIQALIINFFCIILFIFVSIFPTKIALCSAVAFLYAFIILFNEPENNMGIFMFYLGISSLSARGFFNNYAKIKYIISYVILLGLVLTEFRFGSDIFLQSFLDKTGFSFVYFVSIFFIQAYKTDMFKVLEEKEILDLKKYDKLTKRDAEWLVKVINKEKYESIAIEEQLSLGTVKNRFKYIYKELNVGDKQGFLSIYSDSKICFGDDFSSLN